MKRNPFKWIKSFGLKIPFAIFALFFISTYELFAQALSGSYTINANSLERANYYFCNK